MTTDEELELTADCVMENQVASTVRDLVADLERTRFPQSCALRGTGLYRYNARPPRG